MLPTVAILGRPNVGKSTLFNRLVGRREALVDPTPGVTRDRREGQGRLGDLEFFLIDTAGLDEVEAETLESSMQAQTSLALEDADVALLLFDARVGVTPLDRHFADWLRKSAKPVIVIGNKCEGRTLQPGVLEAFELGLGEPLAISAEHGEGLGGLQDLLRERLPRPQEDEEDAAASRGMHLAIVGRPNVGKSTLVNRLLGTERVITGPEPGVTRDAIAIEWKWRDRPIRLIDTAGLRRKGRISQKLEKLSVGDTLRAIKFAEVVVLLVDGQNVGEKQDFTIAREVIEEGRAMVIAVNKWDAVTDRGAAAQILRDRLQRSLPQVRGIPVVMLSALTGRGVERLLPAVFQAYEVWNRRVATGTLNRWLERTLERHPPPVVRGRRLRIRYITQIKTRPPTFALFSTRPAAIPESYQRYIANGLRETFDLPGVPIRVSLRKGKNPYVKDG